MSKRNTSEGEVDIVAEFETEASSTEAEDAVTDEVAAEAESAPSEPLDVGDWQPTIVEPPAESAEEPDAPEAARPEPPEGDTTVIYRGLADLVGPVEIDGYSYSFRPDVPVKVPSSVAEEVLTWPNETFEVVTED